MGTWANFCTCHALIELQDVHNSIAEWLDLSRCRHWLWHCMQCGSTYYVNVHAKLQVLQASIPHRTQSVHLLAVLHLYNCMTIAATNQKHGFQSTQPPQESADSSGTLLASNKEDIITCCKTWMTQERPQQSWSNTVPQKLSMPTQAFRSLFLMLHSQ